MKRNILFGTGALMTIAAGTLAATTAAGAAGSTHTLKLTGTVLQQKSLGNSHEVEADVLRKNGHKVGYATETCFFGSTKDRCSATFTLKGGVLLGHYTFPITNGAAPDVAKGKITGGLGRFTGDKGTIRLVTTSKHGHFTLKYSS